METGQKKKNVPKVLIVDDLEINVGILENIIRSADYEPLCALSVQKALDIMNETMPQLILSDLSMPGMSGLEFCRLLKSNPRTRDIPFVFITVADSREEKKEAFSAGAVDFILKPIDPVEVIMRVNNHINSYRIKKEMEDYNRQMHRMVAEQNRQMEKERENVLLALAGISEKRTMNMGRHLEKVGYNSHILAQSLQLVPKYEHQITDDFIEIIDTAARLHDIGNIVLPDEAVLRVDSEDEKEKELVWLHAEEGAKFLQEINEKLNHSRLLEMAIQIARYHHAHWDGTGYPKNVKENEIPLEARITAVVNGFDALVEGRRRGARVSVEESVRIINERSGIIYDPNIVEVFNKVLKQLRTD